MWIVLGILGFLVALITVILLLPVKIILKNDEQNSLILRYKFLFKTFGENPDPDEPIIKMLKSATGADRLEGKGVRRSLQETGLRRTVTDTFSTLVDLLKELVALLRLCKITRLNVKIRCGGEDAAEAAVHYGQCCAATYTLLGALTNFIKLQKRRCNIDIGCDFEREESLFSYDAVLTVRAWRVLVALWKVALKEAKRMNDQEYHQEK